MSSYSPNIPLSSDDPKVSQSQLNSNFSKINTDFNVDHQQFTASSNSGLHKKITFQNVQVADPNLASPLASLYTKSVSGVTQLFFQNDNGAGDVFQLTNLPVVTVGTNYSILTPWNILIKMGFSASTPITFSGAAFTAGPTIYTSLISGGTAINPRITSISTTQLLYTASTPGSVYYFVAGLP